MVDDGSGRVVLNWGGGFEWHKNGLCYGLAYSTQDMAIEDRNHYLKGEGIGARVCHLPITKKKGGMYALLWAFINWDTLQPLITFLCATKP